MKQRLHFKANDARWISEEELEMFAEEGRFWTQKIFDAIQVLAQQCKATLGSFLVSDSLLTNESNNLNMTHGIIDVVDTCERCLERLRREVFFIEETATSSGMTKTFTVLLLYS